MPKKLNFNSLFNFTNFFKKISLRSILPFLRDPLWTPCDKAKKRSYLKILLVKILRFSKELSTGFGIKLIFSPFKDFRSLGWVVQKFASTL